MTPPKCSFLRRGWLWALVVGAIVVAVVPPLMIKRYNEQFEPTTVEVPTLQVPTSRQMPLGAGMAAAGGGVAGKLPGADGTLDAGETMESPIPDYFTAGTNFTCADLRATDLASSAWDAVRGAWRPSAHRLQAGEVGQGS